MRRILAGIISGGVGFGTYLYLGESRSSLVLASTLTLATYGAIDWVGVLPPPFQRASLLHYDTASAGRDTSRRRFVFLPRRRLLFLAIAIAVLGVLAAHMAPALGLLELAAGPRAIWHMPRTNPPTIYLTYDDGPNAATTPLLLDVLAGERVTATFFLIDREITDRTAPLVARMFADGHAVALHSDSRLDLVMLPSAFARKLTMNAERIEQLTGHRPIRAFRPHAGWRSATMYAGLEQIDYRLVGWGWMRWDWNWYRQRTADATVARVMARVQPGDIIVMHDGNVYNPSEDQQHTIDATARLIPLLRAKGYTFGRF